MLNSRENPCTRGISKFLEDSDGEECNDKSKCSLYIICFASLSFSRARVLYFSLSFSPVIKARVFTPNRVYNCTQMCRVKNIINGSFRPNRDFNRWHNVRL